MLLQDRHALSRAWLTVTPPPPGFFISKIERLQALSVKKKKIRNSRIEVTGPVIFDPPRGLVCGEARLPTLMTLTLRTITGWSLTVPGYLRW